MGDGSTGPGDSARPGSGRGLMPAPLRRTIAQVLVRATDALMRWVTRLLGESPSAGRTGISGAELRDLVAHSTVLNREERRLIDEVLSARGRHVRELMVPRTEVTFLDAEMTLAEARLSARATPHSRFPVRDGTLDDVIGFVHVRDLLVRPEIDPIRTVREIARPVRQLPASKPALAALSEMRRAGDHLALVVDEYGGTAGVVTLEDIIEELVGEIHDEYDAAPEPSTDLTEVDGLLNLGDFAERTGVTLPPGPYDTVGGFVMARLGRLPTVGDEASIPNGPVLRVVAMEGRRVSRVVVAAAAPAVAERAVAWPAGAAPQPVAEVSELV